ncbi:hypothetical protein [Isoptericola cucumis]|uniref:Lipoprotein n=1 Tax=Isoptericola cucumis TaxID=1776856 RepID=A0ABQ2BCK1_9MICO|nr:hypothetical protein [Isoptericola cucumis]GGI10905.1 hypothetical protein GCM10007368_33550 [Isoptericola cucumis]
MAGTTRRLLAAACVLLVVAGCTPGEQDERPPVDAESLRAELRQDRTQYADRTAAVRVVNEGAAPLTLFGGALDAPGFGPSSPDGDHPARSVPPGSGRDVRIRLGDVDCDAPPPEAATGAAATTTEVATATVTVATGEDAAEGDGTEVTLGVTDPLGRLATVHTEVCAERLVATGVRLRVTRVEPATVGGRGGDGSGSDGEAGEPGGRVTLAVEPVPGGPQVRLVRVAGTTLLSPAGAVAWTGDALAGQAEGAVVLDVVPARCDPHAVGEDKRGTFLPVTAEVDGVRQPVVYVPMSDAQRAAVYDLVHDACGWD